MVEGWLAADGLETETNPAWFAGRPVLVTANDYGLRLFNGDTGVAVLTAPPSPGPPGRSDPTAAAGLRVVFEPGAGGAGREFSPSRLDAVETVFAMTVHKSQGSEFDHVTVLLPAANSRLLTRELLYTALTRARRDVLVVGSEDALRGAVERPIARASGLGARLWGGERSG